MTEFVCLQGDINNTSLVKPKFICEDGRGLSVKYYSVLFGNISMLITHEDFIMLYWALFLGSSMVRAFAHGAMGRRIDPSWGGPIELFLIPASAPRLV